MKGKQLALLLALVVILGGLGWYLQSGNRSSWTSTAAGTGGKVINLPLNDVAQITIKGSDSETNLAKKNDVWVVTERGDYPADFTHVSELLRTAWDLKTLQDVQVGPSQLGRLNLLEPGKGAGSATLLEFKDKDGKRLAGLLLGKILRKDADPEMAQFGQSEGMPRGRYVKPETDGAKVSLVAEPLERAETKPEKWLQPTFIKADNLKSVAVVGTTDAQKWKLTRDTPGGEWSLEGAKPEDKVDPSKVSALNFTYSNPSFIDVMPASTKPEEVGLNTPTVATLETMDGFSYTLKIGKLSGDNYPVTVEVSANFVKERAPGKDEKPEDKTRLDDAFKATLKKNEDKLAEAKKLEGRIFLVAKATIEPLLKDRAALLAEKKPETPPGQPASAPAAPGAFNAPPTPGSLPNDVLEQLKKAMPPGANIEANTPPAPPAPPAPGSPSAVTPPVAAPTPPAAPPEKKE